MMLEYFNDFMANHGEDGNLHNRITDGDYSKPRDIRALVEEAFEAGWLAACEKGWLDAWDASTK